MLKVSVACMLGCESVVKVDLRSAGSLAEIQREVVESKMSFKGVVLRFYARELIPSRFGTGFCNVGCHFDGPWLVRGLFLEQSKHSSRARTLAQALVTRGLDGRSCRKVAKVCRSRHIVLDHDLE